MSKVGISTNLQNVLAQWADQTQTINEHEAHPSQDLPSKSVIQALAELQRWKALRFFALQAIATYEHRGLKRYLQRDALRGLRTAGIYQSYAHEHPELSRVIF